MSPDDPLDLSELSVLANVSTRTVRYYIQQGLLPAPEARGPGAHYGAEHLDRLNLIRQLQREHLPLAEIRRRIESLSPGEIRHLLDQAPKRSPSAAAEYIHSVLHDAAPPVALPPAMRTLLSGPAAPPGGAGHTARSQWDRITLAPDVELHIRRPLAREQNRQVERLLEAARAIYQEDEP